MHRLLETARIWPIFANENTAEAYCHAACNTSIVRVGLIMLLQFMQFLTITGLMISARVDRSRESGIGHTLGNATKVDQTASINSLCSCIETVSQFPRMLSLGVAIATHDCTVDIPEK